MRATIGDLNLVVLMIDGIHFGGQVLLAGFRHCGKVGKSIVFGRCAQGATENTTVVKGLLEDLAGASAGSAAAYSGSIDGSKALRAGAKRVFGTGGAQRLPDS